MESTAQIDFDILPPDIRITFPYRTESVKGAVVVDDQVDRPELGRYALEHMFDSSALNKVDREGDRYSAFPANQRRRLIYLARRPRQDGNLGAAPRLMKRDLTPDPATGAGDHCDGAI
jgi:hypothetical protein